MVHQAKKTSGCTLVTRKNSMALYGFLNPLNTRLLYIYRYIVLSFDLLTTLSIFQFSTKCRKSVRGIILTFVSYVDHTEAATYAFDIDMYTYSFSNVC